MGSFGRSVRPVVLCALVLLPALEMKAEDSVGRGLLNAAVRSFRSGDFSEATVQTERALQEEPALAKDPVALRLRVFLALAHHHTDQADRLLRSNPATESDPVLLYQLALYRIRFREYRVAASLMARLTAGLDRSEIERRLREDPPVTSTFPALPLYCPSDRAQSTDGGASQIWSELEDALADRGRASEVWDGRLSAFHLAFADLMQRSFDGTAKPAVATANAQESAALAQRGLTQLLLRPQASTLYACLGSLPQMRIGDREELRLLSALLVRYDDRAQAGLSIAFRFLEGHESASPAPAIEALHALRMALGRLAPMHPVRGDQLTEQERTSLDLRLLILRQLARTYRRLGRPAEAAVLERIGPSLERYVALNLEFPRRALRDSAGENLHQREGLLLLRDLASADEKGRFRLLLTEYDRRFDLLEGQALFRSLYPYE